MRFPRVRFTVRRATIAAIGLLLVGPMGLLTLGLTKEIRLRRLENLGDGLVAAIESHRSHHGRYPESLEAAALSSPTAEHGGFRYTARAGGSQFSLTIGDYGRDLFVLTYWSESRSWYSDT